MTPDNQTFSPACRLCLRRAWLAAKVFPIFGICVLLVSCGKKEEAAPAPPAPESAATNAPASIKPEFARLPGKWARVDGDYLVEIKGVDSSGKLDVGYFNPSPINVSRAAAFKKEGATQVFIELRDVNYPGCTYSLTYDPKTDQLYGQYFQASMQQTFDVTFARAK
jgi:hypothetical protein